MKLWILIVAILLMTACSEESRHQHKLVRCGYVAGCSTEQYFNSKESCELMAQKMSQGPIINWVCDKPSDTLPENK